jgi:hypothetical protein
MSLQGFQPLAEERVGEVHESLVSIFKWLPAKESGALPAPAFPAQAGPARQQS